MTHDVVVLDVRQTRENERSGFDPSALGDIRSVGETSVVALLPVHPSQGGLEQIRIGISLHGDGRQGVNCQRR